MKLLLSWTSVLDTPELNSSEMWTTLLTEVPILERSSYHNEYMHVSLLREKSRSVIGIQGLESESVKKKFWFFPIPIPTDVYRGKNHSI